MSLILRYSSPSLLRSSRHYSTTIAKELPHAVRDYTSPMRIPPHEAEHTFALRDAQKLIHRELPQKKVCRLMQR